MSFLVSLNILIATLQPHLFIYLPILSWHFFWYIFIPNILIGAFPQNPSNELQTLYKMKKTMSKLYCWRCEGFSVGQPGSAFPCGSLAVAHLKFHFVAFSFVCQTWVRFSRRQSHSVPPGGTALTSIVLRTDLSERAGPQHSQHPAVRCLLLSTALSPWMLFLKNKSPVFWWSVEGSKRSWNRLPNDSPNLEYCSHCRGRGVPRVRDFAAHTGRSPLLLLTWRSVLSSPISGSAFLSLFSSF